jgi:glycosyltransferase involved in cell wall biosynthesis
MKISVITPCLDREEFIAEAIESVAAQKYPELEHWIIDGGSTDRTLEIVRRYPHLKVVSESDRGVYDALNKGLKLATGDVIALLNSDDLFAPGAFQLCANLFRTGAGTMIVSGGCQIFRRTSAGREIEMHRYEDARRYQLSLRNVTLGLPIINARFFRRSVFEKVGDFNLDYPIAADRDFLIRAALANIPDAPASRVLYRYRWHSKSLTLNAGEDSLLRGMEDGLKIIQRLIAGRRLGPDQLTLLHRWRRECLATEVMIHAINRRPGKGFSVALTQSQRDILFPFTFFRLGTLAIARRCRTGYRLFRAKDEA